MLSRNCRVGLAVVNWSFLFLIKTHERGRQMEKNGSLSQFVFLRKHCMPDGSLDELRNKVFVPNESHLHSRENMIMDGWICMKNTNAPDLIDRFTKNTSNNPAPIPGCHAPKGCCAQCCGYLDITYQHPGFPLCHDHTTEVLEIRPGFSHPPKLAKPSATKIS